MKSEDIKSDEFSKPSNNLSPVDFFWNDQYKAGTLGWDLGQVSPPIKAYLDQITDKGLRILIPGCGNTYEAEYLLQQGFTDITLIDIAPVLVEKLRLKFASDKAVKIILGDFFAHRGEYDLILEQTFFCALDPSLREAYVAKMKELLRPNGKLVGVLFDREFEKQGPPFGANRAQYISLFKNSFDLKLLEPCYNSHIKREGTELFMIFIRK